MATDAGLVTVPLMELLSSVDHLPTIQEYAVTDG